MQVQNTAMLQQLHERDAEINRLRRELMVYGLKYDHYCIIIIGMVRYYVQDSSSRIATS